MIRIDNLTYKYADDQKPALADINLNISSGEHIAIIGANGCGKTTLLRHLNGLLLPTCGSVVVGGLPVLVAKNLREIRRQVGMIFQNPDNQIVGMTVEEDVAFGPGNLGLPPAEVRQRVDRVLSRVGLTGLETRSPHTLSGGQKQLLAIAGILAMDPQIIALDEPTSSLDPAGKKVIMSLLLELNQQGIAIVHVTHNMEEAARADRVLVLNEGQLIADGPPNQILTRVDWLKSLGLSPTPIAELMCGLRKAGENVDPAIFEVEDAVDEIISLLAELRFSNNVVKLRKVGS